MGISVFLSSDYVMKADTVPLLIILLYILKNAAKICLAWKEGGADWTVVRLDRSKTLEQDQNPKQVLKYTASVHATGNLPRAEFSYVTAPNYKLATNSRWLNGSHHATDGEKGLKLKVHVISAGQVSTTEGSNGMRVPCDQMLGTQLSTL
jgi:hypothetical protein